MAWGISKTKLPPDWYETSGAAHFGLNPAHARAVARHAKPSHFAELMLAQGCAQGSAAAWEEFWRVYQPRLRRSARALTHNEVRGDELADGLLGDLFGLPKRDGTRTSKLAAYSGIGSLDGWLSALLAQAHIERWRRDRRSVSLEDCSPLLSSLAATQPEAAETELAQPLERALGSALRALQTPDRLLLSLYFLDGQTLATIAVLHGVHESTISRRLERTLARLRKQTRRELGRGGLRPAAAEAAMRSDPRWLRLDVREALQPRHGL